MQNAYKKDLGRSIWQNRKRFFAIVIITALGMTMLTGLFAGAQDMYVSADTFFDEQNLFDIRILSTLGLTDDDIDVLAGIDGIAAAEGVYTEQVFTEVGDSQFTADMTSLGRSINMPLVQEGRLPEAANEIAVTQSYLDAANKSLGDTLTIREDLETEEEPTPVEQPSDTDDDAFDTDIDWEAEFDDAETPTFAHTEYIITAVVLDATNIKNEDQYQIRSSSASKYVFFVNPLAIDSDVYTSVYLLLSGTQELNSFADGAYEETVQATISAIESRIQAQREKARYDAVLDEACEKIRDAEQTMDDKFAEADEKLADAHSELADGQSELDDGAATLASEQAKTEKQLADARKQIKEGKQELVENRKKAETEFANAEAKLNNAQSKLDQNREKLDAQVPKLKQALASSWPQAKWDALVSAADAAAYAGDDEDVIAQKTAGQSAALYGDIRQQADGMIAALNGPLAQAKANLDSLQQALTGLDASIQATEAQLAAAADTLAQKQTAATAAQKTLTTETEKLNQLTPGSAEYIAQQAVVLGAQQALDAAQAEVNIAQKTHDSLNQSLSGLKQQCKTQQDTADALSGSIAEMETQLATLNALPDASVQAAIGTGAVSGGQRLLDEQRKTYETEKADTLRKLDEGEATLAKSEKTLHEGEAKAEAEFAKARKELADGQAELDEGAQELAENEQTYADTKTEAEQKLADAYAELDDIDLTKWYVQNRSSLESYSGLKSDMSSIEAVGRAFPIVFLFVAILISLTTMTRMVEEERGLIGTYKAMGFSNISISTKYLLFAFVACLLGGVLGDICGFIFLPKFIAVVFESLYALPAFYLHFDWLYGLGGIALFIVGIVGATAYACYSELKYSPAILMRPKAPRKGARVLLERIPFIWRRLKFLNKVTIRNLFRYKKRMFMTIIGIAGCTALVLCGFAIRDSVNSLSPKQYGDIYRYDLMAVTDPDDYTDFAQQMATDNRIADMMDMQMQNIKLINDEGASEQMQIMVVPDETDLASYIHLPDTRGRVRTLDQSGILLTQNAATLLGLAEGDTVQLQDDDLNQAEAQIAGIVRNYLGNTVYIRQSLYESLLGSYAPNGLLAHLALDRSEHATFAESLLDHEAVLSSLSTAAEIDSFSFDLINAVVAILIFMAGGLAFVVLFTLSNTNISERVRELATIKVLGFYDGEVHQYVNRETLILSIIGIVVGLPVGRVLSGMLTAALNMPSIHFAVQINPMSYVLSVAISFAFVLLVNLITNRTLNRIDMVTALKSVE